MSINYHLCCMDCNEGASLPKLHFTTYEEVGEATLGLLGSTVDGKWVPDRELCMLIDHFLVIHRGHELRLLSELAAQGDFPREIFYSDVEEPDSLDFLRRPVGVDDARAELDAYPDELLG